ncbi:hypothetical protein BDC45DRAFT_586561 [Circinella umbellata]|nr:hypothetical protein BDC45DRAFT_586561 [Circinella umbellata]
MGRAPIITGIAARNYAAGPIRLIIIIGRTDAEMIDFKCISIISLELFMIFLKLPPLVKMDLQGAVLQVNNTGGGSADKHFELQIPGENLGLFNSSALSDSIRSVDICFQLSSELQAPFYIKPSIYKITRVKALFSQDLCIERIPAAKPEQKLN